MNGDIGIPDAGLRCVMTILLLGIRIGRSWGGRTICGQSWEYALDSRA